MKKLLVFSLVLGLCSLANAATFDWNNNAGDTDWYNPVNWTVTGGTTTYPAEGGAWGYATNSEVGTINITDGSTVATGITGSTHTSPGTTAWTQLNILNGSTFNVVGSLWFGDTPAGAVVDLNVIDSTLTVGGSNLDMCNEQSTVFTGQMTNSTITAAGGFRVARYDNAQGTLTVTDSTVTAGGFSVSEESGTVGVLNLVNSTVSSSGTFYMNDDPGANNHSTVNVTGGSLSVGGNFYVNDDADTGAEAYLNLTGGAIVNVAGIMTMPWDTGSAKSHVTVDDATLIIAGKIAMGNDAGGGGDTVESRLFLLGSTVRADALEFQATDSQVVYTGGGLYINNANMTEGDMTALIGTKIDVSGAAGYDIRTYGHYTALVPEPATMALLGLGGLALVRRKRR